MPIPEVPLERTITVSSPLAVLKRGLRAFANGVDLIFSAHSRVAALHRLLVVSDSQLSARGVTRDGEIARILSTAR